METQGKCIVLFTVNGATRFKHSGRRERARNLEESTSQETHCTFAAWRRLNGVPKRVAPFDGCVSLKICPHTREFVAPE